MSILVNGINTFLLTEITLVTWLNVCHLNLWPATAPHTN